VYKERRARCLRFGKKGGLRFCSKRGLHFMEMEKKRPGKKKG